MSETLGRIVILLNQLKEPKDLQRVALCESGGKQFRENGKVIMSPTHDAGILQINVPIHRQAALNMGYDIFTLEGNIGYGMHLYRTEGLRPWVCARKLALW
jgi:hypothetical protein